MRAQIRIRKDKIAQSPPKDEKEFWEQVLHDHGLGLQRGRRKWLEYGHEDREKDSTEDEF